MTGLSCTITYNLIVVDNLDVLVKSHESYPRHFFFLTFSQNFLENCNRLLRMGFLRTVRLTPQYRSISLTESYL